MPDMSELQEYISGLTGKEIDAAVLMLMSRYLATFNGRSGPNIQPQSGDYDADKISKGTIAVPESLEEIITGQNTAQILTNILDCLVSIRTLLSDLKLAVYCKVHYQASSPAMASFNTTIKWNTIDVNIGGGTFTTSNGRYVCPFDGVYLLTFMRYSNNSGNEQRPQFYKNGSCIYQPNNPYGTSSVTVVSCKKNDYLQAGGSSLYPVYMWTGQPHNEFTITLLSRTDI